MALVPEWQTQEACPSVQETVSPTDGLQTGRGSSAVARPLQNVQQKVDMQDHWPTKQKPIIMQWKKCK